MRLRGTLLVALLVLAALIAVDVGSAVGAQKEIRIWKIHYRAHNGVQRSAYVVLPAWYGPKLHPSIPLIISPHGRGLGGRKNAALWGALPARGPFAVVNPDGQGRLLSRYSWGSQGQIEDLARMPEILTRTLPWLRVDRRRIYAFGGSMGGQESLLLLARHPRLLAGAAVFDSVTDLALQYRDFPQLACNRLCRRQWRGQLGRNLQRIARREIGGSPRRARLAYETRSPITYARRLAFSCVPLQVWWSTADRVVIDQRRQSARLFWEIRKLNPDAPVQAFVGFWIHSTEMRATARLPLALAMFDLLPSSLADWGEGLHWVPPPAAASSCEPAS